MITFAKGVTSGTVPMGGVLARNGHLRRVHERPAEQAIELFHGYTYSAHPLACAAGVATLDALRGRRACSSARGLEDTFADAVHGLKSLPNVIDIRTIGLAGAIDLAPHADGVGKRGFAAMDDIFHRQDALIRVSGDTLVLCPPLMVNATQIGEIVDKVAKVIRAVS